MSPDMLTKRQKQILDFITGFIEENGYAPTYQEIGSYFDLSSLATVHQHVKALEEKGYLKSAYNAKRALEVLEIMDENKAVAYELPLVGLIAAGQPIEAIEDNETIAIPSNLVVKQENTFVLKVKGDSMIGDGILSGDYVVVERNNFPQNGDIIVALLDNAYATLKRFYREQTRIRLQPANGKYKPIYVKDLIVQGIVRGVIRNYSHIT
jgi:repressor LexA